MRKKPAEIDGDRARAHPPAHAQDDNNLGFAIFRLARRFSTEGSRQSLIEDFSALRHLDRIHCSVIIAHGTLETPEFQRQAREFAAALQQVNLPVTLLVGDGYNHFEIIETLANPYGLLGRATLRQMSLPK